MRIVNMVTIIGFVAALFVAEQASADIEPVQVFILAGQSNMVGHGKSVSGRNPNFDFDLKPSATNRPEIEGGAGSLQWAVKTMPDTYGAQAPHALVDGAGEWLVRENVQVYARMEVFRDKEHPDNLTKGITRKGALTIGFGKSVRYIGPEFGFGHVVGKKSDQDVLIIKVATGGTSLFKDWRTPTAVKKRGGEVGYMWQHMLDTVQDVLKNLDKEFPEYAGRKAEIVGFGWHQGFNDTVHQEERNNYGVNLADLISDVRSVYGSNLPFVIGSTSMFPAEKKITAVELAQLAAAKEDPRTITVDTRPFFRDRSISPSGMGFHWNHNGVAHYEIGVGMGKAYLELVHVKNEQDE